MHETQVSGELQNLSSLTQLEELVVSGSAVAGMLSDIGGLENLRVADFEGCRQVHGTLRSFLTPASKIRVLNLRGTGVVTSPADEQAFFSRRLARSFSSTEESADLELYW